MLSNSTALHPSMLVKRYVLPVYWLPLVKRELDNLALAVPSGVPLPGRESSCLHRPSKSGYETRPFRLPSSDPPGARSAPTKFGRACRPAASDPAKTVADRWLPLEKYTPLESAADSAAPHLGPPPRKGGRPAPTGLSSSPKSSMVKLLSLMSASRQPPCLSVRRLPAVKICDLLHGVRCSRTTSTRV